MFQYLDLNEDGFIGHNHGCGCCSSDEELTLENLDRHMASLQKAIETAARLRDYLTNPGRDILSLVKEMASPYDYKRFFNRCREENVMPTIAEWKEHYWDD